MLLGGGRPLGGLGGGGPFGGGGGPFGGGGGPFGGGFGMFNELLTLQI